MWSVAFAAVMVIGAGRVQERVDFPERLLQGEPEREFGNP